MTDGTWNSLDVVIEMKANAFRKVPCRFPDSNLNVSPPLNI